MSNVPAAFLVQRPKVPAAFCVKRPQLVRRPRQVAPEDRSRSPTHVPRVVPLPQRELQAPTPTEPAEPPPWTRMLQGKHFTVWVWGKNKRSTPEGLCHITDATAFNDPQTKKTLAWHCGFHSGIVSSVYYNPVWYDKARDLIEYLMNHSHEQSNFDVGAFCTQGRHRSAACAWLIEKLLLYCGAETVDVVHMERNAGSWSHLCTSCRQCLNNGKQKLLLANSVRSMVGDIYRSM